MQNTAFEKCVWGATLIFCVIMLSDGSASAGTLETTGLPAQNPLLYAMGLLATYIGAKVSGSSRGQF